MFTSRAWLGCWVVSELCTHVYIYIIINYIPSFFIVTFWFPKWRSRFQPWKGHYGSKRGHFEEHGHVSTFGWLGSACLMECPRGFRISDSQSNGSSVSLEILYLGTWEFTNLDDENPWKSLGPSQDLERILKGDIQNFSSVKFDHDFLQCFYVHPILLPSFQLNWLIIHVHIFTKRSIT